MRHYSGPDSEDVCETEGRLGDDFKHADVEGIQGCGEASKESLMKSMVGRDFHQTAHHFE